MKKAAPRSQDVSGDRGLVLALRDQPVPRAEASEPLLPQSPGDAGGRRDCARFDCVAIDTPRGLDPLYTVYRPNGAT